MEANIEIRTGDVDADVPMLVIDQRPTVGGMRVFTDGSGLDSDLPTCVLCLIPEEVEEYEEQEEDSVNKRNLVTERWVYDSKTGIEISREKVLEGRKAEMDEMMNYHGCDEVPENEAARKKLMSDD